MRSFEKGVGRCGRERPLRGVGCTASGGNGQGQPSSWGGAAADVSCRNGPSKGIGRLSRRSQRGRGDSGDRGVRWGSVEDFAGRWVRPSSKNARSRVCVSVEVTDGDRKPATTRFGPAASRKIGDPQRSPVFYARFSCPHCRPSPLEPSFAVDRFSPYHALAAETQSEPAGSTGILAENAGSLSYSRRLRNRGSRDGAALIRAVRERGKRPSPSGAYL